MRAISLTIVLLIIVFSCRDKTTTEENCTSDDMLKIQFDISGMADRHCEKTLTKKVLETIGVLNANASLPDSNLIVKFDKSQVNIEQIVQIIEKEGYKVKSYEMIIE